jgi:uncharacterized protein YdhG (YjbR/CyaY superfamily)
MRTAVATIADYIAAQPPAARAKLKQVCGAIRKAAPKAVGSIAYGMPVFKVDGRPLLYVGGWKAHYSLYPSSDRLVAALGEALARYERSTGTIKFPLDEPVPVALITKIARLRLTLIDDERPARARTTKRAATSRRG